MARMVYVDLVTEKGEIVRIVCPEKFEDELYESLEHDMKRGDWWSPGYFDGCRAEYMGLAMDKIAMNKIVGML